MFFNPLGLGFTFIFGSCGGKYTIFCLSIRKLCNAIFFPLQLYTYMDIHIRTMYSICIWILVVILILINQYVVVDFGKK
jgi:hypothetical protein